MHFFLDFRAADRGGAVAPGLLSTGTLAGDAAINVLRAETGRRQASMGEGPVTEMRVIFLIHGFNVPRGRGMDSLWRFANLLGRLSDLPIVSVLWPGDAAWVPILNYVVEGKDADDTAAYFATFLEDALPSRPPLSFATHSLGARVALEAIKRADERFPIRELCLMASAVDDDCLATEYKEVVRRAGRVAVLSSVKDFVLRCAYPLGDMGQAFLFPTTDRPGSALGYRGPDPAAGHTHFPIPDWRKAGHGDYLPAYGNPVPNPQQASAARYAEGCLAEDSNPQY